MAIPDRLPNGYALQDGYVLENLLATPQWQTNTPITALAGGGLSSTTPLLVLGSNDVTVVATAADSVALPSAVPGSVVFVANRDSTDSLRIYCQTTDTVEGAAYVALAAGKRSLFIAVAVNVWVQMLGA